MFWRFLPAAAFGVASGVRVWLVGVDNLALTLAVVALVVSVGPGQWLGVVGARPIAVIASLATLSAAFYPSRWGALVDVVTRGAAGLGLAFIFGAVLLTVVTRAATRGEWETSARWARRFAWWADDYAVGVMVSIERLLQEGASDLALTMALDLEKMGHTETSRAYGSLLRGLALLDLGRWEEAAPLMENHLHTYPQSVAAKTARARARWLGGDVAGARTGALEVLEAAEAGAAAGQPEEVALAVAILVAATHALGKPGEAQLALGRLDWTALAHRPQDLRVVRQLVASVLPPTIEQPLGSPAG